MQAHSKDPVVTGGGGFGGLATARALLPANGEVILIDRANHHLFQPLLYQVATAALSPGDIAWPLRTLLRSQKNVRVVLGEVQKIDRGRRCIELSGGEVISYDCLVLAPGSRHSYFGHREWEEQAPGLKTLPDALEIRERMLMAFEQAERLKGTSGVRDQLTFVIVAAARQASNWPAPSPRSGARPCRRISVCCRRRSSGFCLSKGVNAFSMRFLQAYPARRRRLSKALA